MSKIALFSGVRAFLWETMTDGVVTVPVMRGIEPPQITRQLPTKQPHRKTGVAQSRRDARKRRNRK